MNIPEGYELVKKEPVQQFKVPEGYELKPKSKPIMPLPPLPKYNLKKEKPKQKPEHEFFEHIPKKAAAIEVIKHLKVTKLLGMGAIVGIFVELLFYIFNRMLAYGFAFIVIGAIAFFTYKANNEMQRLQIEYNIK